MSTHRKEVCELLCDPCLKETADRLGLKEETIRTLWVFKAARERGKRVRTKGVIA